MAQWRVGGGAAAGEVGGRHRLLRSAGRPPPRCRSHRRHASDPAAAPPTKLSVPYPPPKSDVACWRSQRLLPSAESSAPRSQLSSASLGTIQLQSPLLNSAVSGPRWLCCALHLAGWSATRTIRPANAHVAFLGIANKAGRAGRSARRLRPGGAAPLVIVTANEVSLLQAGAPV